MLETTGASIEAIAEDVGYTKPPPSGAFQAGDRDLTAPVSAAVPLSRRGGRLPVGGWSGREERYAGGQAACACRPSR